MKNNKGFSLVELIIVIAIMAILVGVMAPQLIKYIEKANVSADTQICDSVRTAITTTMMDPAIVTDSTYVDISNPTTKVTVSGIENLITSTHCTAFGTNVRDLLQVTNNCDTELLAQLKSHGTDGTTFTIYIGPKGANIIVYLPSTDASGAKSTSLQTPNQTTASSCIYAGTIASGTSF